MLFIEQQITKDPTFPLVNRDVDPTSTGKLIFCNNFQNLISTLSDLVDLIQEDCVENKGKFYVSKALMDRCLNEADNYCKYACSLFKGFIQEEIAPYCTLLNRASMEEHRAALPTAAVKVFLGKFHI
jgi:hypothetical protein